MNQAIKLILADDHQIIRQGLRSLLDGEPSVTVVAEAENGRDALALVREHRPHMVLLDISMPGLNGLDAARLIEKDDPDVKVVILSMHADRRFVQKALDQGVSGYLLKDSAFEELIEAIETITAGERYLSASLGKLSDFMEESPKPCLTAREVEVLQLMAEGDNTKMIAHRLSVSVKTVETHRQHIMRKLGIHSVAGLTKYALREGVTRLDFGE